MRCRFWIKSHPTCNNWKMFRGHRWHFELCVVLNCVYQHCPRNSIEWIRSSRDHLLHICQRNFCQISDRLPSGSTSRTTSILFAILFSVVHCPFEYKMKMSFHVVIRLTHRPLSKLLCIERAQSSKCYDLAFGIIQNILNKRWDQRLICILYLVSLLTTKT